MAGDGNDDDMSAGDTKIDYHGFKIDPTQQQLYEKCAGCGKYVCQPWITHALCPICIILNPFFSIEISFMKSKSKAYNSAIKRAKKIPGYIEVFDRSIISLSSLGEFIVFQKEINSLILVISQWASCKVNLNGREVQGKTIICLIDELEYLRTRR